MAEATLARSAPIAVVHAARVVGAREARHFDAVIGGAEVQLHAPQAHLLLIEERQAVRAIPVLGAITPVCAQGQRGAKQVQ